MSDLLRIDLENRWLVLMQDLAHAAGPGRHTVWRLLNESAQLEGLMIYRATKQERTPVVVWIDGDQPSITIEYLSGDLRVVESLESTGKQGLEYAKEKFQLALR